MDITEPDGAPKPKFNGLQATVEDYIALLPEWQEFYKNIIYTAMIIKKKPLKKGHNA